MAAETNTNTCARILTGTLHTSPAALSSPWQATLLLMTIFPGRDVWIHLFTSETQPTCSDHALRRGWRAGISQLCLPPVTHPKVGWHGPPRPQGNRATGVEASKGIIPLLNGYLPLH